MIWAVQQPEAGDEFGYSNFVSAIEHAGQRHVRVNTEGWEATIDLKLSDVRWQDVIPFGSRSFVLYGLRRWDWQFFWDSQYSYSKLSCLGDEFVNHDLQVARLGDLSLPETGTVFIREDEGFNILKGKVLRVETARAWADSLLTGTPGGHDWHPIDENTRFAWAAVKTITDEWRVWIVGRNVISISQYVMNGQVSYSNNDENWEVLYFAQRMAETLKNTINMDTYIMDVFQTSKGLTVGELNCIHCSGWYAINSQNVVKALIQRCSNGSR